MDSNKRIIEIDGVKLEIDLRHAKKVDHFRIGDTVKLLKKTYNGYEVFPAVIVNFTEFKSLPTIEMLYVDGCGNICYHAHFAAEKDKECTSEIAPASQLEMRFERNIIIDKLDQQIEKDEAALAMSKYRRDCFEKYFGKAFPGASEEDYDHAE